MIERLRATIVILSYQSLEVTRSFLVKFIISSGPLCLGSSLPPLVILLVESLRPTVLGVISDGDQTRQSNASFGCAGDIGLAWNIDLMII